MATSACDGMQITVTNSNVTYTDGSAAPITITAAGPASDGSGGTLTDVNGNSPPKVPITVANNGSYTFTASSSEGSGGWAKGTLTIQCMYAANGTSPGTPQVLTVSYSGQPSALPSHASNCTGSGSDSTQSANFTVQGSGSQGKASACGVSFTVMNGGTTGGSTSSSSSSTTGTAAASA